MKDKFNMSQMAPTGFHFPFRLTSSSQVWKETQGWKKNAL